MQKGKNRYHQFYFVFFFLKKETILIIQMRYHMLYNRAYSQYIDKHDALSHHNIDSWIKQQLTKIQKKTLSYRMKALRNLQTAIRTQTLFKKTSNTTKQLICIKIRHIQQKAVYIISKFQDLKF